MSDNCWDEEPLASNSLEGRAGLEQARADAYSGGTADLQIDDPRSWHSAIFTPLLVKPVECIGAYRSELDLTMRVRWGESGETAWIAVVPDLVDEELSDFVPDFNARTADIVDFRSENPSASLLLDAQMRVLAWAYAEWLRIHPFGDGNGRTGVCLIDFACRRMGLTSFFLRSGKRWNSLEFAEAVRTACRRSRSQADATRYEALHTHLLHEHASYLQAQEINSQQR